MLLKVLSFSLLLLTVVVVASDLYCDASADDLKSQYLQQNSIIYALSVLAQNTSVNQACRNQLEEFRAHSLNKSAWAMKMLDASGSSVPGFLFGQSFWLGEREICKAVQQPLWLPLSERPKRHMHWSILNETADYDVAFYVAHLRHKSPWQVELKIQPMEGVLHIGLCAPVTCKVDDLKTLVEQFLASNFNGAINFYEMNAKLIGVKKLNTAWLPSSTFYQSTIFIMLTCVTCATLLLILGAAILKRRSSEKYGNAVQFIKCFELMANANRIFRPGNVAADIAVINGLRVIVSIAILVTHLVFFSLPVAVNQPMVMAYARRSMMLLIHTVVDFFFTISGFLLAYKFFSSPQQLETLKQASVLAVGKQFLRKLFHRWLRLAPVFYIIVCLQVLIVSFFEEASVYSNIVQNDAHFKHGWWRYLLFLHNFIDDFYMVANWTWSMGCELQFFIVGTLLLLYHAKNPRMAKILFLTLLMANFGCYYYYGVSHKFGYNLDDLLPNAIVMYWNPLVRCTPYLVGMFCGWYVALPQRRLNKFIERVIGNLALIVLLLLCILLEIYEILPGAASASILIIARLCLGLWTCWLIIAGVTNRKTWLSFFLEWSQLGPLARLSYAFYLIHPCCIFFVASTANTGLHLDVRLMCILLWGYVVVSYVGAIIFSLAFEMPYCNLSNLIMKRKL